MINKYNKMIILLIYFIDYYNHIIYLKLFKIIKH